ncbi:hypothetical protein [Actinomadura sp. 6N118]|uniref:hypothetical protein n=1 Tax=Actinomadura sp. 6N118 TaxID=3375151 RepID=UPI0037880097
MTHLYEALSWTIDEPERPLEFVIHNDGEVLANVTRVAVRRPDDTGLPYADPHAQNDLSRTLLCVMDPHATPYFYVEHFSSMSGGYSPAVVVAPDGGRIGVVAVKSGGLKGAFELLTHRHRPKFSLRDAEGREVVLMVGPPMDNPFAEGELRGPKGSEIGRFATRRSPHNERRRQHTMRVHQALPEPARTLVLASLLGMEIVIPR